MIGEKLIIKSKYIEGNALANSSNVAIYILHSKNSEGKPILLFLPGFLGTGKGMLFNSDPLSENMYEKLQRLYLNNKIKGYNYIFPNFKTNIGGCQYTNSGVAGFYEDFIIKELIPKLKKRFQSNDIAVLGKSSGGYAAISFAIKHNDIINAAMDHSGDAYFEYCYLHDFPKAREAIEPFGSAEAWLRNYMSKKNRKQSNDLTVLNIVAMAAYYSKTKKIQLPFDIYTGELIDEIWQNWLSMDPVRMVDFAYSGLKQMKFLGIDVGLLDQYNLLLGNRILHSKLSDNKVPHFYEEFDDTHTNISYRYDISIPLLEKALQD
ncbi:MAG: alpha/beta hydrolase-fold protein [Candidatus Micrarchaeaceae archaeon]